MLLWDHRGIWLRWGRPHSAPWQRLSARRLRDPGMEAGLLAARGEAGKGCRLSALSRAVGKVEVGVQAHPAIRLRGFRRENISNCSSVSSSCALIGSKNDVSTICVDGPAAATALLLLLVLAGALLLLAASAGAGLGAASRCESAMLGEQLDCGCFLLHLPMPLQVQLHGPITLFAHIP